MCAGVITVNHGAAKCSMAAPTVTDIYCCLCIPFSATSLAMVGESHGQSDQYIVDTQKRLDLGHR